jgi:hypothetical protein
MTAWGLLSTARINRLVLAGARNSDHVDVIAVASRDRARAETYAREHSIEHAYESYDALLQDPAVEAVYISLPNSMHVEWTVRALAARKHVLSRSRSLGGLTRSRRRSTSPTRRGSSSRKASCGVTTRRRPRSRDWSPKRDRAATDDPRRVQLTARPASRPRPSVRLRGWG